MIKELLALQLEICTARLQHGDCELAQELEKWIKDLDRIIPKACQPNTILLNNDHFAEYHNREVHAIQAKERE